MLLSSSQQWVRPSIFRKLALTELSLKINSNVKPLRSAFLDIDADACERNTCQDRTMSALDTNFCLSKDCESTKPVVQRPRPIRLDELLTVC